MTALTAHAQTPPAAAPAPNTEPETSGMTNRPPTPTRAAETQSLPIGNSSIGGNVFGRYDTERVTLNEKSSGPVVPAPAAPTIWEAIYDKGRDGAALKEIQDLFLAGKTAEGSAQMDRDLIGTQDGYGGYQNVWKSISGLPSHRRFQL